MNDSKPLIPGGNQTIITLPQLIALFAKEADTDALESRKFLHDFFSTIQDALSAGQQVKIKGLGTFIVSDSNEGLVEFHPDQDLASMVNEPFSMFTPIEVGPDFKLNDEPQTPDTEDSLAAIDHNVSEKDSSPENITSQSEIPEAETETGKLFNNQPSEAEPSQSNLPKEESVVDYLAEETADDTTPEETGPEDKPAENRQPVLSPTEEQASELFTDREETVEAIAQDDVHGTDDAGNEDTVTDTVHDTVDTEEVVVCAKDADEPGEPEDYETIADMPMAEGKQPSLRGFVLGLLFGLACGVLIGAGGMYYVYHHIQAGPDVTITPVSIDSVVNTQSETPATAEDRKSITTTPDSSLIPVADNSPDTPAIPAVIHDTISSSRFLASMARKHYGHMEYWVYIYEANPGLGHPDKIKPGTVVVIPPKSSFQKENDEQTMEYAKRTYASIYQRYSK